MTPITIWFLLLIGILYWEYRLSRAARFFADLKMKEPETYKALHGGSRLPPSVILNGIIANNQYGKIKADDIKKELLDIDFQRAKYAVMKMYLFVVFVLIALVILAIYGVNSESME